jgi:hypothetical protein
MWRRRGTELGAIDLDAKLHFIQKTCLAQLVKYKTFKLVVVGSSPTVGVFNTFLSLSLIFLSIFFVYVANLSVLIYFSSSFIFVTDLFIRPDFFYPASTTIVYAVNSKIYHP